MTVMAIVTLAALVGAFVCSGLRWLRVAQREHYLAGSVLRFAKRWWLASNLGVGEAVIAVAACGLSVVFPLAGVVTALIIGTGPLGLPLRGRTSKLNWTRRLRTVAGTTAALAAIVIVAAGVIAGTRGAAVGAAVVVLACPLLIDAALYLLAPLERSLAQRFVRRAKAQLARVHPTIVAITGSYGKTSTKGYVAHLLSGRFQVLASPQSYNNQAGLSRTVNELLVPGVDVLVAEMGAYGKGEIASLCAWLPPQVAVITAIGPVHLERFKTLDRTVAAKSEITVGASFVVLNIDDVRLSALAAQLRAQGRMVIGCSAKNVSADVAVIANASGLFDVYRASTIEGAVALPDDAATAATNVACAIGVAIALGCAMSDVVAKLGDLPVPQHRLAPLPAASGATILDDTFNSNPAGARRALAMMEAIGSNDHQRVLVTPGMVELGPMQFEENAGFTKAASAIVNEIIVVGQTNKKALLTGIATTEVPRVTVREAKNRNEAVQYVASHFGVGDVILYENDLPDHFP